MSKCKYFVSVRFLDEGDNNKELTCSSVDHTIITRVIAGKTEEEFAWNVRYFIDKFVKVDHSEVKEAVKLTTCMGSYFVMVDTYNDFIDNGTFIKLVMQKANMKAVVEDLLVKPWQDDLLAFYNKQVVTKLIQNKMKNRLFPLIKALQYMKVEK